MKNAKHQNTRPSQIEVANANNATPWHRRVIEVIDQIAEILDALPNPLHYSAGVLVALACLAITAHEVWIMVHRTFMVPSASLGFAHIAIPAAFLSLFR